MTILETAGLSVAELKYTAAAYDDGIDTAKETLNIASKISIPE